MDLDTVRRLGAVHELPALSLASHSEVFTRHTGQGSADTDPIESKRQRLEWLGDSFLSNAVSEMLYKSRRHWPQKDLHHVRSVLVSNLTLCNFAYLYGFHGRAMPSIPWPPAKGGIKRLGDIFEMYIGAMYETLGASATKAWINKAFKDLIDEALNFDFNGGPRHSSLASHLRVFSFNNAPVRYIDIEDLEI